VAYEYGANQSGLRKNGTVVKAKKESISLDDRIRDEKEAYNRGLDRKKYNAAFGHAQSGYHLKRRNEIYAKVLQRGKNGKVLELGSTSWKKFVDLDESAPAELTCINISEEALKAGIKSARYRKTSKKTKHEFKVMDAHKLEFPDDTFDVVFGREILHHLDYEVSAKEMARVLKNDGQIVFLEPLGRNPIGKFVRWRTPDKRTAFEKPVDKEEIEILEKYFDLDLTYQQLFTVPVGALSKLIFKSSENFLMKAIHNLDLIIEKATKRTNFGLWYRQVIIVGTVKK